MKIAIIGWGSLIWCPGSLQIQSNWHHNGPMLPIEFSRISNDGRLTLVIVEGVKCVRTYWATSVYEKIEEAIKNLSEREQCSEQFIEQIKKHEKLNNNGIKKIILEWLKDQHLKLDAAILTALPPKNHNKKERIITESEAINYLTSLKENDINKFKRAEEYIRNAPSQIDTRIRQRLRNEFGWKDNLLPSILFEDARFGKS